MLPLLISILTIQVPTPAEILVDKSPVAAKASGKQAIESEIPPALRSSGAGGSGLLLSVGALGALGAAAWFARRRRTSQGRFVQLLETTSLGPKRSLVLATLGGKTLLLGASEAGITMLACLPNLPEALPLAGHRATKRQPEDSPLAPPKESVRLASLFKPRGTTEPSFDILLDETLEDQELRTALSHGVGGKVQ